MDDLKLYYVVYSVHTDKNDWYGCRTYVFAKNENGAMNYIIKNYKQVVTIRAIEEVPYEEGTLLKRI